MESYTKLDKLGEVCSIIFSLNAPPPFLSVVTYSLTHGVGCGEVEKDNIYNKQQYIYWNAIHATFQYIVNI